MGRPLLRELDSAALAQPPAVARLGLDPSQRWQAAAHELRNALAASAGWTELARRTQDPALRERALRAVELGLRRARALTALFAQESTAWSVGREVLDARTAAREAVELLEGRARQVGVTLALEHAQEESPALVLADGVRLGQVLTNLVLNALDAVHARGHGGSVRLRVSRDAERVRLCVADDGVGLSPEALARLGEPFATSHPEEEHGRPAGTGLGFVVTRALVEAMDGELSVRSTRGEGTEVTLALPAALEENASSPLELASAPVVLVVDDDASISELLETALRLVGLRVVRASTLRAAEELLRAEPVDLVLADEHLGPGDSGSAWLARLRAERPSVGAVLLTGAPVAQGLTPGIEVVYKPFAMDELTALLGRLLGRALRPSSPPP